jgi:glycosyltransferase involved in cell wall biosynthesis
MARHCEVWVVTEEHEFREDIERFQREHGPIQGLHFHFVPRLFASESVWQALSEIRPLYYAAYRKWHERAYEVALDLHREVGFDVAHQSTMCGYREPGELWRLDVPFVWGPVGGTQNYPWRFLPQAGGAAAVKEASRSLINAFQMRYSRRVRNAARRAGTILTAIPAGQGDFARIHGVETTCMLDVGVDRVSDRPRTYGERSGPLRLLWSGYFEYRKALQLLLRALAEVPDGVEWELRIVGAGPQQRRWRRLARRLGLEHRCTFMGWLSYGEAMAQSEWADVFVFTSLRDTCGTVVLEALSQGLPVICLDHQGVGHVVTDECGLKVPVRSPRQVITGLKDAIVRAAHDNPLLESLSRGAIRRASEFSWDSHGTRLDRIYTDLIDERVRRCVDVTPRGSDRPA